jgi:hypothetical protein
LVDYWTFGEKAVVGKSFGVKIATSEKFPKYTGCIEKPKTKSYNLSDN